MNLARFILNEINSLTEKLIDSGLSAQQLFPIIVRDQITWQTYRPFVELFRAVDYPFFYNECRKTSNYNIMLLDGALVQMYYRVTGKEVLEHRLAFLPSPELVQFDQDPDLYESQDLYGEIVEQRAVPFPMRFDFKSTDQSHSPIGHPKCHLHLGQYSQCRIPVSSPLTPNEFLRFLLRHFYNASIGRVIRESDFAKRHSFSSSLHPLEQSELHIVLGKGN